MLRHDFPEDGVYFSSHIGGVTADVEVSLLQEELVDFFGVLLQSVLDVDFVGALAGEGCDKGEFVAKDLFVFLDFG